MLRLTLRTLLAYLDDTLSPAQAREIGQQIADEPSINDLIGRIKSVMRRRRLQADLPDPDHAEIDPNEIAEYLDSRLSAARVAELEKKILESDQDLAETASVHQILSLVLGKPSEVPNSAKERAYKLLAPKSAAHVELAPIGPQRPAITTRPSEPLAPLPSLDAGSARGRFGTSLAVVALLLLLAGAVYLTVGESTLRPLPPAIDEAPVAQAIEPTTAPEPGAEVPTPTESTPTETTPVEEEKSPVEPALPIDPLDEIPEIDATKPAPADGEEAPPATEVASAPTPEPVPEITTKEVAPEETPKETVDTILDRLVPVATYESPTGILLRRAEGEWSRLKPKEVLHAGEEIAHPHDGTARVEHPTGLAVDLVGPTRVRLRFDVEVDLSMELVTGRTLLTVGEEPARVNVRLGEETWDLFLTPTTGQVALEVATFDDIVPGKDARRLLVHAVRGEVEFQAGADKSKLAAGESFSLPTADGALPKNAPTPAPAWIEQKLEGATEKILERMSDAIPLNNTSAARYRELVRDNNKEVRALAIEALAVMGEIDTLADSLRDLKFAPVRMLCFQSLRALARMGANAERDVHSRLTTMFGAEMARTLVTLLVGYTTEQKTRPETYRNLLMHLDSPEIAVRESAIQNLRELTGKDFNYAADASSAQRKTALGKWQKWLDSQTEETLRTLSNGKAAPPEAPSN